MRTACGKVGFFVLVGAWCVFSLPASVWTARTVEEVETDHAAYLAQQVARLTNEPGVSLDQALSQLEERMDTLHRRPLIQAADRIVARFGHPTYDEGDHDLEALSHLFLSEFTGRTIASAGKATLFGAMKDASGHVLEDAGDIYTTPLCQQVRRVQAALGYSTGDTSTLMKDVQDLGMSMDDDAHNLSEAVTHLNDYIGGDRRAPLTRRLGQTMRRLTPEEGHTLFEDVESLAERFGGANLQEAVNQVSEALGVSAGGSFTSNLRTLSDQTLQEKEIIEQTLASLGEELGTEGDMAQQIQELKDLLGFEGVEQSEEGEETVQHPTVDNTEERFEVGKPRRTIKSFLTYLKKLIGGQQARSLLSAIKKVGQVLDHLPVDASDCLLSQASSLCYELGGADGLNSAQRLLALKEMVGGSAAHTLHYFLENLESGTIACREAHDALGGAGETFSERTTDVSRLIREDAMIGATIKEQLEAVGALMETSPTHEQPLYAQICSLREQVGHFTEGETLANTLEAIRCAFGGNPNQTIVELIQTIDALLSTLETCLRGQAR